MSPFIKEGDHILVEPVAQERLRFGDVVVFGSPGSYVIHRVVGRRRYGDRLYLQEKGDANLQATLIPAALVIGRVRAVRRGARTMDLTGGRGRALQWALGANSRAGLGLWRTVERVLARTGREAGHAVTIRVCRKLCSLAPALLLGPLNFR
jgi:hypothetical protein